MNRRFEALSRICLNNWHYINRKILSFHQDINFFTGHSGSGKSTVIDALQIVLYANTDGRGFFNKAAADDSDRNLIEYLRGMVNIGENNEFAYLRNQNFSSTIVLELMDTETRECQCVGIVFDVDTSTNDIGRKFFWHKGPLWDNGYRTDVRTMTMEEVETYLKENYTKEEYFSTSHNERFRRLLYECYLGGLDMEKFPLLFKRAIPFRMNIKLEDFVKEYICTEQDIHIEDMQESVMQYGRMRKKLEDTYEEIRRLQKLQEKFLEVEAKEEEIRRQTYFTKKMEILELKARGANVADRILTAQEDGQRLEEKRRLLEEEIRNLRVQDEELLKQISSTGYEEVKNQLNSLSQLIEILGKSEASWQQTTKGLKVWAEEDTTSNQTIWDMEEFAQRTISRDKLERLKRSIGEMRKEAEGQKSEAAGVIRELKRREQQLNDELDQLKAGNKAYPKQVERAKAYIQSRLLEETGKAVEVWVLADLLEVENDQWRNAVEGYLGGQKLSLVVEPAYARRAMELYGELDKKEYWSVAVLDTEKAGEGDFSVMEGALSQEVSVRRSFLQPVIDLLLGKVIKCRSVEELRKQKIGVTPEGILYHSFRIQHINPDYYTKMAYIGKDSVRSRIRILEKAIARTREERLPKEQLVKDCDRILSMESLSQDTAVYMGWKSDMEEKQKREKEKIRLERKLDKLREQNIDQLNEERAAIGHQTEGKRKEQETTARLLYQTQNTCQAFKQDMVQIQESLTWKEKEFELDAELDAELSSYLEKQKSPRYDKIRDSFEAKAQKAKEARDQAFQQLTDARGEYARNYPNRNFSLSVRDNREYDQLLEKLRCGNLEEYRRIAGEQARSAVEHFKDDFIYKIRSAIKEALLRKDELNRIISRLDFGKDKYQFVIGRNRGEDGKYFDMFMDDSLEINPSQLEQSCDNQMNLFTMDHENHYGELMNELIGIFIPPENATAQQLEEAKRNMAKYADYRTYLSFDMQQLIQNQDEVIKIRLSKMIKKNSGGEGQNPLYVALLASFAQAYKISSNPRIQRNPTIRLVVLDEAFSKMDGEKVASCIELIRGLGFQAIISATNDKIQNYVENVDKTFVFANPNKKSISIQEFEKEGFQGLMKELEE